MRSTPPRFPIGLALGLLCVLLPLAAIWSYQQGYWSIPSLLPAQRFDVLIQAGHENRATGKTGAESRQGSEQQWTPIVADTAARILKNAGFTVKRVDAFMRDPAKSGGLRPAKTRLALFIHFDGAERACSSGASVGYSRRSDPLAAEQWKRFYDSYWPHEWMQDNFTENLRRYYGYRWVDASDAEMVLELGELTCPRQARWLKPRLEKLGELVAQYASTRLCQPGGPAPPLSPRCGN